VPLGQPIIIDNRGTNIGAAIGAKAPPDGYTLIHTGTQMWLLPLMRNDVVTDKDFAPITMTQVVALVLVVNPSVPAKSVKS
jgi:tripartite-type tricarboxylate transporter receptor subunit TctC